MPGSPRASSTSSKSSRPSGSSVRCASSTWWPLIGIGREHGLAVVFGVCLVASVVAIALGFSIGGLRRLFPPLVNGVVVMLIGLTLIRVGMDYVAS